MSGVTLNSHTTLTGENRSALFSGCQKYRYVLGVTWANHSSPRLLNFLMLNPSTEDHKANDPTVERCQRRAMKMGFDGLIVTNLFAFRSTDPALMKAASDPIGIHNDRFIIDAQKRSEMIICGWGNHGAHLGRGPSVRQLLREREIHYLKLSKTGQPWHPLYVSYDQKPVLWEAS